jgi:DNA-binding response OmpR family regulator
MRVLLVEDDEMIGQSLVRALSGNGWSVDWVKEGLLAQSTMADGGYACVLLDLGLPKRDGIEVLRTARAQGDATPVLVLTARDGVEDRITGLDIGADDYLIKPYEFRELLARMRAVIRRRDGSAHSVIGGGDLQLDLTTREVLVQGERSQLSAREFALLHALLERPGAILSRDQLESRIYGWGEEVSSNAVDVLIHGMRRKLGADTIRNVRGLGWRIAATGPAARVASAHVPTGGGSTP